MTDLITEIWTGLAEAGMRPGAAEVEALADLGRTHPPQGALRRLWSFGGLQAQVSLAYLAYWARSWLGDADRRERELAETHLRAAMRMLRTMGYLRGAVSADERVSRALVTWQHRNALPSPSPRQRAGDESA